MKIVIEKIRDLDGNLVDISLASGDFIPATQNDHGITWVQMVGELPLQAFTDKEILVIDTEDLKK
jgi:hypothetical protein